MSGPFKFFMAAYLYRSTIIYLTSPQTHGHLDYSQVFSVTNSSERIKPAHLSFYTGANISIGNILKTDTAASMGCAFLILTANDKCSFFFRSLNSFF